MHVCPFNSCCALRSRAKSKLHNFDVMICRTLAPIWTQLFLWMTDQEWAVISKASLYIYFSFQNHGPLQSQTTRSSNSIKFCLNIIQWLFAKFRGQVSGWMGVCVRGRRGILWNCEQFKNQPVMSAKFHRITRGEIAHFGEIVQTSSKFHGFSWIIV